MGDGKWRLAVQDGGRTRVVEDEDPTRVLEAYAAARKQGARVAVQRVEVTAATPGKLREAAAAWTRRVDARTVRETDDGEDEDGAENGV